eukprot:gnl/MRDRNA2_/MRDRNA2_115499_c0_seq1.p1 gnl/MRDRNA2_/MRDRNA2_115499_c0~~gnl/MRDRNA2_/MRDRNA2_115499_c0_seq1.p1  ORF type:complete len:395 (+),score=85.06 gnl/MRDRNA2_/MRDRNA2_115499_c0_seq1:68-1252(+)
MRILIVGGGCTGSATAALVRKRVPNASLIVWEKARGAGGRYTTSRQTVGGRELRADMGAQVASVDPTDKVSCDLMESLVQARAAEKCPSSSLSKSEERWQDWNHYRGIPGQNGILKALLDEAKAEVVFERRLSKLDKKGSVWTAAAMDGTRQDFDAVFICVPGCGSGGDNLNKIHGSWERQLSNADWAKTEVPHDCRFAVALFLERGQERSLKNFFDDKIEKRIKGDMLELLFWQSKKNSDPSDGPQVVVAHTWQGVKGNKSLERAMVAEACSFLKISPRAVAGTKIITWYQSQVTSTQKGKQCLVASSTPPLILAGDYFTSSSFTGCVQSASAAVEEAAKLLGTKPVAKEAQSEKQSDAVKRSSSKVFDDEEEEKRRKRAARFGYPSGSSIGA